MRLRNYIFRRLLMIVPLFFFTTILVFTLIHLAPGDPVMIMFGTSTPYMKDIVKEMRETYGLDKPLYIQYFIWLSRVFRGDLGYSYLNTRKVIQMISERGWPTIELMVLALVFSVVISTVFGVFAAVKRHSIFDNLITTTAVLGRGMPNFWLAMNLILIFSIYLGWLPVFGRFTVGAVFSSPFGYWLDRIKHLILPVISLSAFQIAYFTRLIRSTMLDVLGQEYIITARAKGLKESVVIYKHALKNALLPVVTVVGIYIGSLMGGAAIIESLFAWPGMGRLLVNSTYRREYQVLMSLNMIIIFMVLVSNLITDVVYAYLDPRIKY
jgi:peptide/nickel transport system permease protein